MLKEGGLGLFSLDVFLGSQACTWAKRAQNLDDNWKLRLYRGSYGNTLNLRCTNFNKSEEPILYNIAYNMERFQNLLSKIGDNYKESYIMTMSVSCMGAQTGKNSIKTFLGLYSSNDTFSSLAH
jgi:hypothetical protein